MKYFTDSVFWDIAHSPQFMEKWGTPTFIKSALGEELGWSNKYNSVQLTNELTNLAGINSGKSKLIITRLTTWLNQVIWIEKNAKEDGYQIW